MMKPNLRKDNYMKKFKILLSLITITILLTSCGMMSDWYGEEKYGDWTTPVAE